jgi:hypothetical protein
LLGSLASLGCSTGRLVGSPASLESSASRLFGSLPRWVARRTFVRWAGRLGESSLGGLLDLPAKLLGRQVAQFVGVFGRPSSLLWVPYF